jgi:myo-inositol-1(or 4)-monophosphatase
VDPIDGTGNYYRGYLSPDQASPDWGVSVGIIRDGKVAAGIIYQPQTKALYFAERGKGAFMNDEKIHVSDQCEVRGDVLTGDSPYPHDKVSYAAYGKAVERYSQELGVHIEQLGSQVIDAMLVARGKKAGFLHFQTKPWDIAAAISIVTEAGGKVMDIFGQEYTLFEKTVLMTNGTLDIEEITKIAREELATATN